MKETAAQGRIVAAYDASPAAEAALAAAVELAKLTRSPLEVVYARSPTPAAPFAYDGLDASAAHAMEREARRFRAEWLRKAKRAVEALPRRRVMLSWISGWPEETLLRRGRGADLIVAGTRGRRGARRLFLGSVAERLVRDGGVPVLCLHEGTRLRGRILAPFNLRGYAESAVSLASDLGRLTQMPLTALYVASTDEPQAKASIELDARLECVLGEAPPRRIEQRIRRGDPRVEIVSEASEGRYGLVVLSSHVGSRLRDRALGSTAERLLRRTAVPVLTVPPVESGRFARRTPWTDARTGFLPSRSAHRTSPAVMPHFGAGNA